MMQYFKKISSKHILIFILLLTAFLRLYRLDYPDKYVFDEVYHAFTAKEFLAGHKEGWEWWNTPPAGVAYEWTHPPLAKEMMAISMFIFRTENAWAYRLPGVIMGVLSVYLIYLIGLKLINNQTASLIAAFAFSLDGLNFVQSRTGMNDIYYVTFVLSALLLLLRKKYLFSAILLGLALSSKWASVYAYLVFIPILLKDRKYRQILFFLTIPGIVYFISYLPFFLSGHSLNQFKELQQQIWWYHTNLKATHAYTSPWWSWPLNLYPVWYFVDYQKNSMANIFTSGNPVVFWSGSIAIILSVIQILRTESINHLKNMFGLIIILLGFFAFWLPWSLSPRIMFLYHFSPSVPFLSLALGHQLSNIAKGNKGKQLTILLLILIAINFAILFPFLTGIFLPRDLIKLFFFTNLSKNPF